MNPLSTGQGISSNGTFDDSYRWEIELSGGLFHGDSLYDHKTLNMQSCKVNGLA